MSETGRKIAHAILHGKLDDDLTSLQDAIQGRIKMQRVHQAVKVLEQVRLGTRVRVLTSNPIKPQYLKGAEGAVVEITQRSSRGARLLLVQLDRPVGKFRTGRVLMPTSALEILEA